jgi:amino acid transporter
LSASSSSPALERRLGFRSATTINVLAMVGVGPFLTIPLLLQTMQGPQAMLGWLVGAIVAIGDGQVWAELGAAMPRSGGGYQYVLEAYDRQRLGRLMSFLFLWQTVACIPLTLASGAVGFSQYAMFLYPSMTAWQAKALAMSVSILSMLFAYRRIDSVGRWGTAFGLVVVAVAGWIIGEGILNVRLDLVALPPGAWDLSRSFWLGLGTGTLYAMYTFSGYNTVCNVGDEVIRPEVTIPRSIVVSILAVAVLYLAMTFSIISVMPWQEAMRSKYIASDLIARLHPGPAASFMTVLILIITMAGLFAGMLGASRIPYAAATNGRFFKVFARLHPTKNFPSFAVIFIGVASAICSVLEFDALVTAVVVISVMIGSFPVLAAVAIVRRRRPEVHLPFRMWLYPVPVLIALAGWTSVVVASGLLYFIVGLALLGLGIGAYLWRARQASEWPFEVGQSSG